MNGWNEVPEELLSAYLDGELSRDEREQVESALAASPAVQERLDVLRGLTSQLNAMHQVTIDENVFSRIMGAVEAVPQEITKSTEVPDFDEVLLSAYLDGELTGDERALVELHLAMHADVRQDLKELRALQASLQALPRAQLDAGFAERVLQRAAEVRADEVQSVATTMVASDVSSSSGTDRDWQSLVWAAIAMAASLLAMFYLGGEPTPVGQATIASHGQSQKEPTEQLAISIPRGPMVEPSQTPTPNEIRQPSTSTASWQLVSALQQQSRQRLVLVYEVAVRPEGVEAAAFANLLRRHNIGFRDMEAVNQRDRRSLLKQRFLKDVQIVPRAAADMDEVQLFLVSCSARQADSLWFDLASQPPGIAALTMNLTTGSASEGVLNKLCESTGIGSGKATGVAVPLLVEFAILSKTARNLGAFGTIGHIDPSLLTPPAPAEAQAPEAPPVAPRNGAGNGELNGDFAVELLFVVRNLKPLDPAGPGQ